MHIRAMCMNLASVYSKCLEGRAPALLAAWNLTSAWQSAGLICAAQIPVG